MVQTADGPVVEDAASHEDPGTCSSWDNFCCDGWLTKFRLSNGETALWSRVKKMDPFYSSHEECSASNRLPPRRPSRLVCPSPNAASTDQHHQAQSKFEPDVAVTQPRPRHYPDHWSFSRILSLHTSLSTEGTAFTWICEPVACWHAVLSSTSDWLFALHTCLPELSSSATPTTKAVTP